MVLIAASMVGTSTFAWFSMNSTVTVTGMTVSTEVADNLLIASSSTDDENVKADSAFKKALNQTEATPAVKLQPVSTISAANDAFYYTYDAKADGGKDNDVSTDPYIRVSETNGTTITVGTTNYVAYADYVFELKAINTTSTPLSLRMTKLNLLYKGAQTDNHAFRVAAFIQNETTPQTNPATYEGRANDTAANYIFAPSGWTYHNNTAVSGAETKAATNPTVNANGFAISVGSGTHYYKITIRLWLEGEDTHCYNTKFLDLTADWRLDLGFKLVATNSSAEGETAVTSIGSAVNAVATPDAATATGSVTVDGSNNIENGEKAASYQWYKADGTTVSGATNISYKATATGDYYCLVTTANGNVYRTNNITLTPVAITGSGAEGSVTLDGSGKISNGETPEDYAWKNDDGTPATGTNNAATYTATTSGKYYCVVTTSAGTYTSNIITLTVG